VLTRLFLQPRIPDVVLVSAVDAADLPDLSPIDKVRSVFGGIGLTAQRNRGIAHLNGSVDIIAFIDDDFIVGDDYFLNMERIFAQDPSIVGVIGEIIADGANSAGFTFEEGLMLAEQHCQQNITPITQEIRGFQGSNGIIAIRTANIGSLRFDERLPLYGWQEDLDFCSALSRSGRVVKTSIAWGVHLGIKRGKGSGVRLGYSQIINPAYIVSKGNMSLTYAFRLASRNLLANVVKSIRPESYIDRRGRLRGNVIGMFHLMTGRLTPEYILQLE
jgi:GT2 family glycosyltransferase